MKSISTKWSMKIKQYAMKRQHKPALEKFRNEIAILYRTRKKNEQKYLRSEAEAEGSSMKRYYRKCHKRNKGQKRARKRNKYKKV